MFFLVVCWRFPLDFLHFCEGVVGGDEDHSCSVFYFVFAEGFFDVFGVYQVSAEINQGFKIAGV